MLSSLATHKAARTLKVKVNGRELEAHNNETVLELCDRHNIKIPRLCHHPALPPRASCRVCLVECNGQWLSPACVTTVWDGLSIDTQSPKVEEAVKANLAMLLETHDERCTSCVKNFDCSFRDMCYDYNVDVAERQPASPETIDKSTPSLQLDVAKCVLCGRCVRACSHVAGQHAIQMSNRAHHLTVEPAGGVSLAKTNCIQCGQCTLYCPVGALTEKSEATDVMQRLSEHKAKFHVCQIDPACGVTIGEAFGAGAGKDFTPQLVTAARDLGFDMVFSTETGNDLYAIEEAEELLKRIKDKKTKWPMFSSACPAWINYCERSRPDLIKKLGTTRTPDQLLAALIKNKLAARWPGLKINPEDIFCATITPCLAKKDSIKRAGLQTKSGIPETDVAISVRELVQMMRLQPLKLQELKAGKFDAPYGEGSQASRAFVSSGGVADAVVRTAYKKAFGTDLGPLQFTAVKGLPAKIATVDFNGTPVKVAVAEGTANTVKLVEAIEAGHPEVKDVIYVEALACTNGCVVGGGSPHFEHLDVLEKRHQAVTEYASKSNAKTALDCQAVRAIHDDVHKSHELLRAKYAAQKK